MDNTIFEQVDAYISHLLGSEDEVLRNITRSIEEHHFPNASISANQGKFLQIMALACSAQTILELGTFCGYSTVWLARVLPPGGRLISIEADPHHHQVAQQNMILAGLEDRVDLRLGNAKKWLDEMEQEGVQFDFVFIDADKPPYKEYVETAIRLCRKGAIIVADNVVRNGAVLDSETTDEKVKGVQRLNEFLGGSDLVTATILQNVGVKEYDGMAIMVVN